MISALLIVGFLAVVSGQESWCRYPHSYIEGYAGGWGNQENVKFSTLEEALAKCTANAGCTGVTKDPFVDSVFSLREGDVKDSPADRDATSWVEGSCESKSLAWCKHPHQYVEGYTGGWHNQENVKYPTLEEAQAQCIATGAACTGITKDPLVASVYSLRRGELKDSPSHRDATSWVLGICERKTVTWCRYPHKYLEGYTGGWGNQENVKYSTLQEAQAQCIATGAGCTGVTKDPVADDVYSLRRGDLKESPVEKEPISWVMGACVPTKAVTWCRKPHKYIEGYTGGWGNQDNVKYSSLKEAQAQCIAKGSACTGITKDPFVHSVYSLREGDLKDSPTDRDANSWVRGACDTQEVTLLEYY